MSGSQGQDRDSLGSLRNASEEEERGGNSGGGQSLLSGHRRGFPGLF
jgi:hypothetical protein